MTMIFGEPPTVRKLRSMIVFSDKYIFFNLQDFHKISNCSCISLLYLSLTNEDFMPINNKTRKLNDLLKTHI